MPRPYKPDMCMVPIFVMVGMEKLPEYVQIEPNETVASVRDRLSFIRGQRVLLIWPEKGTALTRKLDLVMVQREARRRVLQIALVTHDEQVINHARELGISTFETVGASRRGRWKRGRTRVFVQRYHRPDDKPEPDELMSVASRIKFPRKRISFLRYTTSRLIVLIVLFLVIGGTSFVVLPYATVDVALAREVIQSEITITADPQANDVDVEMRLIPATILSAQVQTVGAVEVTGSQQLEDARAVGVVTFVNQTSEIIPIPVGTRVSTTSNPPAIFRTSVAATLTAGNNEQVDVPIEAEIESSGDVGNVSVGAISFVLSELSGEVVVSNAAATTGGETRLSTLVTAQDQDRLLAIVRGQLQESAFTQMTQSLSENQTIVVETVRIAEERNDWTTFSHNVGDVSNTISLEMRAIVEALAIDDRFARQLVLADLSTAKPAGLILQPDTFAYTIDNIGADASGNRITFTAQSEAVAAAELDFERIRGQLVGLPLEDADRLIRSTAQLAGRSDNLLLEVSPAWLGRLPLLPMRIAYVQDEVVEDSE